MDPSRLIRVAEHLTAGGVSGGRGRPHQTDLRRALSAAYYALFHALATVCANQLAGAGPGNRNSPEWLQTYRALEHGQARRQLAHGAAMLRFPESIQNFARQFLIMQRLRQEAEYDPSVVFEREEVAQLVEDTRRTLILLRAAPKTAQRSFALHVLLRPLRE